MTSRPVYRSLSVERRVHSDRLSVFAAALATADPADDVLSHEPPWRIVTRRHDPAVELQEITVAIVETLDEATLFSVSAVLGPENSAGALDAHVGAVGDTLESMADSITARLDDAHPR